MANCLIAQSGGPTSVINATLAGILEGNDEKKLYKTVYGGLHGIEGILNEELVKLKYSPEESLLLKQTPASILGSCRYKLNEKNENDFVKVFNTMDKYDIETFFYIGGNDSMDTVDKLRRYAEKEGIKRRFIGCPKTIDNDLVVTDHSPGYGSAAKFIAQAVLSTSQDFNIYKRKDVSVLEIMGRDAGWLAAASYLNKIPDLVLLPEVVFDEERFLSEVEKCLKVKNKCYIVTSEGVKFGDNEQLVLSASNNDDGFNHASLSGGKAGNFIKSLILNKKLTTNCKVLDLGILQRCFSISASKTDIEEAFQVGKVAFSMSEDKNFTGKMITIERDNDKQYNTCFKSVDVGDVANKIKYFPKEWILDGYKGISDAGLNYILPLIKGNMDIIYKDDGMPVYLESYTKLPTVQKEMSFRDSIKVKVRFRDGSKGKDREQKKGKARRSPEWQK